MYRLIRDLAVVQDDWTRLPQGEWEAAQPLPPGKLIVPLAFWLHHRDALTRRGDAIGLWLNSDEHPEAIHADIASFPLVAINFPVFSDGRGYSYARIVREQYGYRGELRAVGDVLRDQLFLMRRCGFDSFELRADRDPESALAGLHDFQYTYQGATVDIGVPLLLRRSTGPR